MRTTVRWPRAICGPQISALTLRVYDAATDATVASTDLQGVISPGQVTMVVSAQFETKDVGSK